jgi:hypothetical protein
MGLRAVPAAALLVPEARTARVAHLDLTARLAQAAVARAAAVARVVPAARTDPVQQAELAAA